MTTQNIEDLSASLTDALNECVQRGMALLFIVVSASRNGSVLVLRTRGDDIENEVLAEHFESEGFPTPVSIMVLDQNNKAALITIGPECEDTEQSPITRYAAVYH